MQPPTEQGNRAALDHFYTFGDVYETLDACDQLELLLGRLRRQGLLNDDEWARCKDDVIDLRGRIERLVNTSPLAPKGPRLS